ncbi:uncharacterized protein BX663DRAFT_231581 [Cokeromyces recurvatus]|uniref:uncharacterized protein n=1 Tax=Cokeromyces recurvatus TaxID=90255 RepID=UPI00221EE4B2|nr:uncharacterized protein BX663DRAFT_231581 [Cokeromyces recurvatus]KAI7898832.1 hypothetical protein BX663DRAFT_231581 [Cokeromyces recurvatus]
MSTDEFTTNNKKQSSAKNQIETSFDPLIPSFKALADGLQSMHNQFESLVQVNNSLIDFNESFSAFLLAMAINDTTVNWTKAPTEIMIERHIEHMKRMNSLESTKPVQPQITSTGTKQSNQSSNNSTNANNKKRKIVTEQNASIVPDRRFVSKININSIIDHLPLRYRERSEPMQNMKKVLKVLKLHPSGLTMKELARETQIAQYKVTECINALIHAKEVMKTSEPGQYSRFHLDQSKYPSQAQ